MKEILVKYTHGEGWYRSKLIQCKDCKYCRPKRVFNYFGDIDILFCDFYEERVGKNEFCSKAERKEQ